MAAKKLWLPSSANETVREQAFAKAIMSLWEKYPNDAGACAFAVLSQLNLITSNFQYYTQKQVR